MESKKGFWSALFDLSFSEFVTTRLIKVLFVLAMIFGAIMALTFLGTSFSNGRGLIGILMAPVIFFGYVILVRVSLELTIVIFKIAENTTKIAGGGEDAQ